MQDILDVVRKQNTDAYGDFIEASKSPLALRYLAEQRAYLLSVLPLMEGDFVLLIDGVGGALTRYLVERNCRVTAWEPTTELCELHRLRLQKCTGEPTVHVEQLDVKAWTEEDFKCEEAPEEGYDIVIGIDVLPSIRKEDAAGFVSWLSDYLKPAGKLVLTSENPMGIKYLAGAKDPYTGELFSGMKPAKTDKFRGEGYSLGDMDRLACASGMQCTMRYYPFPDAYFPTAVYSDRYLPKQGELHEQVKQDEKTRYSLFDEDMAFDKVIEQGTFPQYAHSYMWVLQKEGKKSEEPEILYCKLSNNRGELYRLYTLICEDSQGKRQVIKRPIGEAARAHVEQMDQLAVRFFELFKGSRFVTNSHRREADGLHFSFVEGTSLSGRLDRYLENEDYRSFYDLLDEYMHALLGLYSQVGFVPSPEFVSIFGVVNQDGQVDLTKLVCGSPVNIDMITDNILEISNQWCVIDGEWGFDFDVPIHYVMYRVIHYYLATNTKRTKLAKLQNLYERYGISAEEQRMYEGMERSFQEQVAAKGSTIFSQKLAATKPVLPFSVIRQSTEGYTEATVYFDRGKGYGEEDVLRAPLYPEDGVYTLELKPDRDVRKVRFDIAENSCILRGVSVTTQDGRMVSFTHNGVRKRQAILFATKDPQIQVVTDFHKETRLLIRCEYEPVSESIIRELIPAWKRG